MTKSLRDLTETLNSNALNNHIAQQNELAKKNVKPIKNLWLGVIYVVTIHNQKAY